MSTFVYALSISGRITLDMHSLNNEGGEGNQLLTRMVNIVHNDPDNGQPRLASVNAISGDMFKHIQVKHLHHLAKGNLPLCAGCATFSPSRIMDDETFMKDVVGKKNGNKWLFSKAEVTDQIIRTCTIDDLEGILIAPEKNQGTDSGSNVGQSGRQQKSRPIARKSVAEFGWVIGLPHITRTGSYFHVRYASEQSEHGEEKEKVTQPIFHRPASSGVYATVATFEMARIGFNDISQRYAIEDAERKQRYEALLESVLYTFVEPNGAMRSTQNPHILGFEGIVTVSTRVVPAPTLSPLDDDYVGEIKRVAAALNHIRKDAITVYEFSSMGGFADIMRSLISDTQPYELFPERG